MGTIPTYSKDYVWGWVCQICGKTTSVNNDKDIPHHFLVCDRCREALKTFIIQQEPIAERIEIAVNKGVENNVVPECLFLTKQDDFQLHKEFITIPNKQEENPITLNYVTRSGINLEVHRTRYDNSYVCSKDAKNAINL